jgi:hypothetical protein
MEYFLPAVYLSFDALLLRFHTPTAYSEPLQHCALRDKGDGRDGYHAHVAGGF